MFAGLNLNQTEYATID